MVKAIQEAASTVPTIRQPPRSADDALVVDQLGGVRIVPSLRKIEEALKRCEQRMVGAEKCAQAAVLAVDAATP